MKIGAKLICRLLGHKPAIAMPELPRVLAIDPMRAAEIGPNVAEPIAANEGRFAIIGIKGALVPRASILDLAYVGDRLTSYEDIAESVRAAEADPSVQAIILRIDSPGGELGGLIDCADAIHASRKPVRAEIVGTCASAAYLLASQADRITATRGAVVGSLGVYCVLVDESQALANAGIALEVISSGGTKGAGADGKITDDLRAVEQQWIDGLNKQFLDTIARARPALADSFAAINTGEVWLSDAALSRGLIDSIETPTDLPMETVIDLIAAEPAFAAHITTAHKAGSDLATIKASLHAEKAKAQEAAHEREKADLRDAVAKATVERDAAKATADAIAAKHAAVTALADGAKAGNKIKADASEGRDPKARTRAEVDVMSPSQRAKFYADGGTVA